MKNERNSKDRVKKKLIVENCIEKVAGKIYDDMMCRKEKNDNIVSQSDIQYS